MRETYLVVGLGNYGDKYKHTRHNAGFDSIDLMAKKLGAAITKRKSDGLIAECDYKGKRVVLVKPQTYMNDSGRCVSPLVNWYKIDMSHLIVIYDDIDLPAGQLRVRKTGSAGTHNGMRSIIGSLGKQDFPRIRVGVGAKPEGWDLADWVLSRYQSKEEQDLVDTAYERAAECALMMIEKGDEAAMQLYNRKEKAVL